MAKSVAERAALDEAKRLAGEIFDKFDVDGNGHWTHMEMCECWQTTRGQPVPDTTYSNTLMLAVFKRHAGQDALELGIPRNVIIALYSQPSVQKELQLPVNVKKDHKQIFSPEKVEYERQTHVRQSARGYVPTHLSPAKPAEVRSADPVLALVEQFRRVYLKRLPSLPLLENQRRGGVTQVAMQAAWTEVKPECTVCKQKLKRCDKSPWPEWVCDKTGCLSGQLRSRDPVYCCPTVETCEYAWCELCFKEAEVEAKALKEKAKKQRDPANWSAPEVVNLFQVLLEAYSLKELQNGLKEAADKLGGTGMVDYFKYVKEVTAIVQQRIFEHFGIPPPPAGLALITKLTHMHVNNPEVYRLSWACGEALGVNEGLYIKHSLDLPFFRQTDPGSCLQTSMKMVLKWHFPNRDYSLKLLNEKTGRTDRGKWTCTPQALPALVTEGLDAHFYSDGPFEEFLSEGEEFVWKHYGDQIAPIYLRNADFESVQEAIKMLKSAGRYTIRKLELHEMEMALAFNHVIILLVDYNKLFQATSGQPRPYAGHFVTLTGVGNRHIQLHDSLGVANRVVEKTRLWEAWDTPGTDNDAIIIKGRLTKPLKSDAAFQAGFTRRGYEDDGWG
mmetsp:Transcript_155268/g.275385  ORF Transcript_155268/g.275385 Transcript_155268/m.275385 type:complete len:614 (-) Transcript_155268:33-1874(-)